MEPILSVEHLRRDYGGRGSVTHAVDDVSFRGAGGVCGDHGRLGKRKEHPAQLHRHN